MAATKSQARADMIIRKPIENVAEWHEDRLRYIGASEVAVVCGMGGYSSTAELYAEKKRLRPARIDTGVLRRGRWGEAAVFQALQDERPNWEIIRSMVHVIDTDRRIACTPDGFVLNAPGREGCGIVQTKVISRSIFRERWLDDPSGSFDGEATVPPMYRLQTVCERMLNESHCKWAVLAVIINSEYDWAFRLFDIEADEELEGLIVERVAAFYRDYLDPGIMPPFEPQEDERLIRALYPKDDGSTIDLTEDNRALVAVDEWIETAAALKRLRDTEAALKTELIAKLGQSSYGKLPDGRRLSWRLQHRKAYSVEPADYRVLRILKKSAA